MGDLRRIYSDFRGWSARTPCPLGFAGKETANINTARGFLWPDGGYKIVRQVSTGTTGKAGGSWTHRTATGAQYPFYAFNTALYRETGSGATSIASGLTETFVPTVVPMAWPAGISVFLNGTNSQAQCLRTESGTLAAVAFDMTAPGGTFSAANGTGGSLANGTYYVRVTQIDDTGSVVAESSAMSSVTHVLAGANDEIVLDLTSTTFATRATKYRVYLSTTTDTLSAFYQTGSDTAKATTSFSILTSTQGQQLPQRGGIARTSVMPLTGARLGVAWNGRLFIANTNTGYLYWSERDAPNQWYSTNGIASQAQGQWNDPITGLAAAEDGVYVFTASSIHRVYGSLIYDSTSATIDVRTEQIDPTIGCVAHGSIVPVPGHGIFFMSSLGPCAILGGRVMRLAQEDIRDYILELDFTYSARWIGAYDPSLNLYCVAVGRKVNSSRTMDGQAVAGFNDRILRWSVETGTYSPPLALDTVHLSTRPIPASLGDTGDQLLLTAFGPHASALRLNFGKAFGDADGVVTSSDYDGKLASSSTTTSATYTRTAGSTDDLQGMTITLRYPSTDSNYPGIVVQRTISGNTYSGGNVVVSWAGALTVPSGTNWTVRLNGVHRAIEVARGAYLDDDPKALTRVDRITTLWHDVIGAEAAS